MSRESVVVVGAVGKLPYGGMSFYWGHHIVGLQELGYDVHYVERLDFPNEAYKRCFHDRISGASRFCPRWRFEAAATSELVCMSNFM